ncbi:glycosyltransferase domain-containing protein [Asaia bogorensis]|uniref:glycosyltransferase domain-containing protein n=1 Tax=Asaia bogorensis TaxID=91915 RepID=UPI00285C6025|nr:glycosyltransferase domain-containing protein [Asaia bogorensis]MDR6183477.1 hypothetical protein [Asaia bogorensis NBRC 16594]
MFNPLRRKKTVAKKVVYTCLFGFSEKFQDVHYEKDGETDFVCLTDDPDLKSDFWDIRLCPQSLLDSHRYSKSFKHRPHKIFRNYDDSLYIDNTVKLKTKIGEIFNLLHESNKDILLFKHPWRDCIYDEAKEIIDNSLDDEDTVRRQMLHYEWKGFPRNAGLHATTVLLRRHMRPSVIDIMDTWHDQVLRFSKRDQLSLDVCRRFLNADLGHLPGSLLDNQIMTWPVMIDGIRLPRDFDEKLYLTLNPDLSDLGMNLRKHYLTYGIKDGRKYK